MATLTNSSKRCPAAKTDISGDPRSSEGVERQYYGPFLNMKNKIPDAFYGYMVVLAGFIILVVGWGSLHSFGVFLKHILSEFGWTMAPISGAYSLFIFQM